MSAVFHYPFAVAIVIAALPALACWWSGRRLSARLDDPALPERLLGHQQRNGFLMVAASAAIVVVDAAALPWAFPLMFASLIAAGFPLRRVMFDDTWTFATYMSVFHRLTIAFYGLWVAIGLLPALSARAGSLQWLVGISGALVLLAWNHYHHDLVRAFLRCRPLEEGPRLARFRELASRCGMPEPVFLRADLQGGVVANAVALPSLRGNAVAFTGTLLDRFEDEEVAAVCAHELAHLEYFNPARLRQMYRWTVVVIVLGAIVPPAARSLGLSPAWAYVLFGVAMIGAMVLRARDKQRQETVCDARAAELVGPEPMISALSKLYAIARMPRRIDLQQDKGASHPSLARRIRDIRRAAGVSPTPLREPITIHGADGRSFVTFENAAVRWADQPGVTQVLSYSHLVELRFDIGRGGPRLRAVGDGARRWEMRLAERDIARVQAVLDAVDVRLADTPGPRVLPVAARRWLTVLISLLTLAVGHVVVALLALMACLRPASSLLAGAAAGALTAAAITVRDRSATTALPLVVVPLLLTAALLLLLAFVSRGDEQNSTRGPLAAIGIAIVMLSAVIAMKGLHVIHLHQSVRSAPALTVLLVAFASTLAFAPARRLKLAALAVSGFAVAAVAIASAAFIDHFAEDPFLVPSPALAFVAIDSAEDDVEVPDAAVRVRLSPSGLFVAAFEESESGEPSRVQVGRLGEELTAVAGDAVHFMEDETALILNTDRDGTTLRQVRLNPALDVLWRQRLPHIQDARLSITAADRGWHIEGWDAGEAIVRADGVIGTAEMRQRRWPAEYTRDAWVDALTTGGPEPIVVETRVERGVLSRLPARTWMLAMMLTTGAHESRYWSIRKEGVRPLGQSRLPAECVGGMADGALACTVFDGTRTRLLRIDAHSGAVSGIGWVEGRLIVTDDAADGWLTGWYDSMAVAIDLADRRALYVPRSEGFASSLAISGGRLAALISTGGSTTLRRYRIPDADQAATQRAAADGAR